MSHLPSRRETCSRLDRHGVSISLQRERVYHGRQKQTIFFIMIMIMTIEVGFLQPQAGTSVVAGSSAGQMWMRGMWAEPYDTYPHRA